jgi:HAD superfamily hydrolase (TIGR01450 family)
MAKRDAAWAVQQYEAVRTLLPKAQMPGQYERAAHLCEIADEIDVFLLDAFGVLNVGNSAITGAVERVAMLREMGKRVLVLTNSASFPANAVLDKFARFGFAFQREDVVSSRDALAVALSKQAMTGYWAVMSAPDSAVETLGVPWRRLEDRAEIYDAASGFVLLSTADWTETQQALLQASLASNPRPVFVGNPDIVAPREHGLSLEPGFFAYNLARELGVELRLFGKPFGNIFDLAFERLPDVRRDRVAMVGDTLHTDVLGGAAYGVQTILVSDHGLFSGCNYDTFIAQTGIMPNYVIPNI